MHNMSNDKKGAKEAPKKTKSKKLDKKIQRYYFPEAGVAGMTIVASSREEAEQLLRERTSEEVNTND